MSDSLKRVLHTIKNEARQMRLGKLKSRVFPSVEVTAGEPVIEKRIPGESVDVTVGKPVIKKRVPADETQTDREGLAGFEPDDNGVNDLEVIQPGAAHDDQEAADKEKLREEARKLLARM